MYKQTEIATFICEERKVEQEAKAHPREKKNAESPLSIETP